MAILSNLILKNQSEKCCSDFSGLYPQAARPVTVIRSGQISVYAQVFQWTSGRQ